MTELVKRVTVVDGCARHEIMGIFPDAEPVVLFTTNNERVFDYVYEGALTFFRKIFANLSPVDKAMGLPMEIFNDSTEFFDELWATLDHEGSPVKRFFEAVTNHSALSSNTLSEKRFRDEVIKKQVAGFEASQFATIAEINAALCPVDSMFGLGHLSLLSRGTIDMGIVEHHFKNFLTLEFFKRFSVALWDDVQSQDDFGNGSLNDIDLDYANSQAFSKAEPNVEIFWNLPFYSREFREFVLRLTPDQCRAFVPATPRDVSEDVFMGIVKKNMGDYHAEKDSVIEEFLWGKEKSNFNFSTIIQKSFENFDQVTPGIFAVQLWEMNIEITKRKSTGSGYRKFFSEFFLPEPPMIDGKIASINEFNAIFAGTVPGYELIGEKYEDYLLLKVTELLGAHAAHVLFRGVVAAQAKLSFGQLMELAAMWDVVSNCPHDWWSSMVTNAADQPS